MLSPVEPTLMVSSEGFTFVACCCMFASFFSTEFCPRPGVWPRTGFAVDVSHFEFDRDHSDWLAAEGMSFTSRS